MKCDEKKYKGSGKMEKLRTIVLSLYSFVRSRSGVSTKMEK